MSKQEDVNSTETFSELFNTVAEPARKKPSKLAALVSLTTVIATISTAGFLATAPIVIGSGVAAREATSFWNDLPTALPQTYTPRRSVILDRNGTKIAEFFSENRVLVKISDVPDTVKGALLAIEDTNFYTHNGVDPKGLGRAIRSELTRSSFSQGGSTLTQQYVKNVRLLAAEDDEESRKEATERSYIRKVREARYALALEKTMSKEQIMEGYLNVAYYGSGAYGIGTASRYYFGKPVNKLTVPEAALLVGIVQNPTGYDPTQNPKDAKTRRDMVMKRMSTVGYITPAEYTKYSATPIKLNLTTTANGCGKSTYPFYCQQVRNILENDTTFGKTKEARQKLLFKGGLIIRTALDPKLQKDAQNTIDTALGRSNRVAGSIVTIKPGTGEVLAMASNRSWGNKKGQTQVILATQPSYQPGSTFKAFTLAAALENGYTPNQKFYAPDRYSPPDQNFPPGGFRNSSKADVGDMNAYTAMARSSNTWFVKLQREVGVTKVAELAKRIGLKNLPTTGSNAITNRDASLTLGAYETSPVEMAAAYATFDAQGKYCNPTFITAITGSDTKPLRVPDPQCQQVMAPGVANTVTSVLTGVIDGKDPARTASKLSLGRPAAGKTGTTDSAAAVWFVGYTPQYSTSVWLGDPRGAHKYPIRSVNLYGRTTGAAFGGTVAGPIWKDYMTRIHKGLPTQKFVSPDPAEVAGGFSAIMPDVRGMQRDKAIQIIQEMGYDVKLNPTTAPDDNLLQPNRVAVTDPPPGERVGYTGVVTLTLTAGSDLNVKIPPRLTPAKPKSATSNINKYLNPDTGGGIVTENEGGTIKNDPPAKKKPTPTTKPTTKTTPKATTR